MLGRPERIVQQKQQLRGIQRTKTWYLRLIFAIALYCTIQFLDFVPKSQKLVQTKIDFATINALKTTINECVTVALRLYLRFLHQK